jgi:hypothetical protein
LASLGPGRFDSLVSLTTVDIGSLGGSMLPSFARLDSRGRLSLHTKLLTRNYFGCRVWAIITWRLKFSTMLGSRRTSVGFFAIVMVSILSCSFSSA